MEDRVRPGAHPSARVRAGAHAHVQPEHPRAHDRSCARKSDFQLPFLLRSLRCRRGSTGVAVTTSVTLVGQRVEAWLFFSSTLGSG